MVVLYTEQDAPEALRMDVMDVRIDAPREPAHTHLISTPNPHLQVHQSIGGWIFIMR